MDDARPLLKRLFEFLEAYNQKRNPVIRDISRYEKVWWWDDVPTTEYVAKAVFEDPSDSDLGSDLPDDDEFVLKVARPTVPGAPTPPEGLSVWVTAGWNDPRRQALWSTERDDPDLGHLVLSEDEKAQLDAWKTLRDAWAARVAPDYVALELFQWLWDVHSTLEREAERYELVIGEGVLAWETNGQPASHPLLIQRLQVEFDSAIPSFTVTEADRPTELYSSVLRALGADPTVISGLMELANAEKPHPLGEEATSDFLTRAAGQLHPQGRFLGFARPVASQRFPQIVRSPVLFLRTRALGYEAAIQAIKEDLDDGSEIPDSLSALVGVHTSLGADVAAVDPFEQGDEAEDVLLTKEANREQLEIARRLGRYGAVLVQGPPGTGKTHTIANLIGHLLANGKTVLVTSHTTKALRVLREKVVPELQPLCVSVLEGDAAGNAQLAAAVTEIGRRLSSSSEDQLRREAEEIRAHRNRTLQTISEARARLLNIVRGEYSSIVLDGKEYSPTDAAQAVHDGVLEHSWIPGKISVDSSLPLSATQVRQLYELNDVLPEKDLRELRETLPDPALLPTPAAFAARVHEFTRMAENIDYRRELWQENTRLPEDVEAFTKLTSDAFLGLNEAPAWYVKALDAAMLGEEDQRPWLLLKAALAACQDDMRDARLATQTHAALLPPSLPFGDITRTLDAILSRLRTGKGLPGLFMSKDWKLLIKQSSVLGKRPATLGDFEVLFKLTRPRTAWNALAPRWHALMTPLGEPIPNYETQADEAHITKLVSLLSDAAEQKPSRINGVLERASELGFELARLLPIASGDLASWWPRAATAISELLPAIAEAEVSRLRLAEIDVENKDLVATLSKYSGQADPSRPVGQVISAILSKDIEAYSGAYEQIKSLHDRRAAVLQRDDLLARLSPVAHDWAEAIRIRHAPHGENEPPSDALVAWHWKQLAQVLDSRSAGRVETVISEISNLRDLLREQTTVLIDRLAWAEQAKNTTPEARQSLSGYVELVRRIGNGTGRRAPRLREAARRQMSVASAAVPVWIAPLSRVAEAFDPRTQRFDVVIIDEASQSDVLGLISWYLGKHVVVVGDDQQVTPDAVGERIDDMTAMIDTYLRGIPNRELYDGQASIYQLATTAFRGVVRLREHFRCLPEIISFSDALCYGDILPLRDPSTARVTPAVISHRVESAPSRASDVNEVEAQTVASLVVSCLEQPEYEGLTLGVISMLGTKQSARIEQILRNVVSPPVYQERRILCGSPPHFQGDERDVVFLTMVDIPPEEPPLSLRGDPGDRFKKRYNVAASRAKDQLWVVHSLDRQRDLKTDDLRWRLLDWAANPGALEQRKERVLRHAESPFEADVIKRLINAGYSVQPQYSVGAYRIDLVVKGNSGRLAVECDGGLFHSTDEQIRADLDRQALLERMGWRFHRIRGSEFYRDPDASMRRLTAELSEANIIPTSANDPSDPPPPSNEALMERVKARASELRREWWGDGNAGDDDVPYTPAFAPVGNGHVGRFGRPVRAPLSPAAVVVEPKADSAYQTPTTGLTQYRNVSPALPTGTPGFVTSNILPPTDDQPVAQDRPAGANLHPHLAVGPSWPTLRPPTNLELYQNWPRTELSDPRTASQSQLIDSIQEIVSVEGPIMARRVYELIVKASGGHRLTKLARSPLNRATAAAVRSGLLAASNPLGLPGEIVQVLRLPGTNSVRLRTRGDRDLLEIPQDEVVELINLLRSTGVAAGNESLKRAILDTYGLVRMTAGVSDFLDRCIARSRDGSGAHDPR